MSEQAKQGEGQSLLLKTQFHHTLTNTSSFSPQAEAHGAPAPRKQGTIIMIITVILEVAVGCAAINLTLTLIKLKYPHTNSPYSLLLLKNESIFRVVNSLLLEIKPIYQIMHCYS